MNVYKKILLFILPLVLLIPIVHSSITVGIWPAEINMTVFPFERTYNYVYLFNPGDRDVNVKVSFICNTCKGKSFIDDLNVNIYPSYVNLKNNTTPNLGAKQIVIDIKNNLFIKKIFVLKVFGKSLEIPFYAPILGNKYIKGKVVAETTDTKTIMMITSKININLVGISYTKFILFIFTILFFLILIAFKYYKETKKMKMEERQINLFS